MDIITTFLQTVEVFLKGMFGVFIFMVLFYFIVKLLTRIVPNDTKE